MIRRPPRSTLSSSSAASDVYKRQILNVPDMILADGSPLGQFREENKETTPEQRARSLEEFTAIHELYKETAAEGNEGNQDGVHVHKDEEGNEVEKTFHFIAYVRNGKGQLVELDGTKAGPWVIAEGVSEQDFMAAVGAEYNRRIAEGEIDQAGAVMALGKKAPE
eukprot:TRINITY_DN12780_c0_g1_i5.p1 TRINITY_DN12780_c0_g1~~TRINITY_DN12780_c0_g1_i5.p1  ORF type:complete len:165 (+),score=61.52 TRINITY_DN12780_c0_g1_i5:121-615(+)